MKKKIAIIINSLATGGAEKTVSLLINELCGEFEIHLLMFNTTNIELSLSPSVHLFQIGKPSSADAGPIEAFRLPWKALQVKKYLLKYNIPLVFSFLNRPNFIAGYLKLFGYKGKTIINERSNTSYYFSKKTLGGRFGRFLVKRLYSQADLIITNADFGKNDLQQTFGIKNTIITINNGINYTDVQRRLDNAILPFGKKDGEFIFCHIGRNHPTKNQELLLRAFAGIENNNCRLVMVGKDVQLQLNGLAQKLAISDRVILKNRQADVLPYYAVADAFVLSSDVEGFPNVILEALACHLPVIATDCKWGPREILAPGTDYPASLQQNEQAQNGILVPVNNEALLAGAMQELMNNKELYNHYKEVTKTAIQKFDEAEAVKQFKDVITGALAVRQ